MGRRSRRQHSSITRNNVSIFVQPEFPCTTRATEEQSAAHTRISVSVAELRNIYKLSAKCEGLSYNGKALCGTVTTTGGRENIYRQMQNQSNLITRDICSCSKASLGLTPHLPSRRWTGWWWNCYNFLGVVGGRLLRIMEFIVTNVLPGQETTIH